MNADGDALTVDANGLTFECLRWGDGDRLALCLHGFPDDPGTFDALAGRFTDAGYAVVAPYMRGYGPTGAAPDGDYSATALGRDAVELADALAAHPDLDLDRETDPVLVGHDWGAVAAYAAARIDPDAFARRVTMAVPPRFVALLRRHPRQVARSWYIWFFQIPGIAERTLRARDFALVEFLWNTWSPGWNYPKARIESVKRTLENGDTVEHALAYYRQVVSDAVSELASDGFPDPNAEPVLRVPTLVVAGGRDGCIGPALFERAGEGFESARVVRVREAGHFMHHERPDAVADEVVSFLERGG